MSKAKIIIINIILFISTVIIPLVVFHYYTNYRDIQSVQKNAFKVLLVGGLAIFLVNYKYKKVFIGSNFWLWVFEIVGVLTVLYSLVGIYLIAVFKHGIGF